MNFMPEHLPDDPALLKQMLEQMLDERQLDKGRIVRLEEQESAGHHRQGGLAGSTRKDVVPFSHP